MKLPTIIAALFLGFAAYTQDFEELMKVVASDRDEEDRLGWSVDVDGEFAIVGAYADDFGGTDPNMGSAYIYESVGGDWVEIQKIFNSDQDDYDRFGWSVAIDGDYAIVGAYAEDHDELDGEYLTRAGSAYIFERNDAGEWVEVQKIVAGDRAADDEFGWSVAIHGTTAVVGAHIDDKDADGMGSFYHAGSAYVFDRGDDGTWSQTQKIVAPDRSPGTVYADDHEDWNDRFGESVGIWNDYIVVGGPFASKAYTFERSGGVWSPASFLTYPGISWLDRAAPVSIDSTTIILGAQTEDHDPDGGEHILNSGGAMVFNRTGPSTWTFTQKISPSDRDAGDHFGISVSIDLPYIVVGAHSDNHDEFGDDEMENTGSIFVYQLQDDGTYLEIHKLDASDRAVDDELGISVSISGNTIVAGAFQQDYLPGGGSFIEDAGAAYFYEYDDGPDCETVLYTQEAVICSGGSFEVGDAVYEEEGVYTDEFLTDEGCDSIVTTILEVEPPIETEQEVVLCNGESYTIGDEIYTESTIVMEELSTDEGCDSVAYTILVFLDPINTETAVDGLVLEAFATGVDYQWIKCDPFEIIDGATGNSYEATENGDYAVIIYEGDCVDTSDCQTINSVGLFENGFGANFSVYPNPSNGQFTITGKELNGVEAILYNAVGSVVYRTALQSNSTSIQLHNLADGMYILALTGEKGTRIQKLEISR